jgi:hypothetical protein
MQRLDLLRISLLASLTGCLATLDDGGADGQTTTTMGSSAEGEGTEASGTGTGDGDVCEMGCEGATVLAEGIVQCSDGRVNRVGGGNFDPTSTQHPARGPR